MEYLGAFLPGLKKFVKKVGKVTSKITTAAAKFVGVPQSAINALAKVDPTKKGTVVQKAVAAAKAALPGIMTATLPAQQVVPVPSTTMGFNTKKMLIIGGAGVGGLVLIGILAGAMRRRA
jgi:hypothetical protein